ncbi:MAG: penicillin-binding protein 2 [Flavobacteriaceae bacterium]
MNRKLLLPGFTVFVALLFAFRLGYLQISSNNYQSLSENNAVIERPVYPERGYIYDRNGTLLVANQPAFDLMAIPEQLKAFDTLALTQMLGITPEFLTKKLNDSRRYSVKLPSVVVAQIDPKTHGILQEKIWKYPGFYLQDKSQRAYHTQAAANLLGYVSEVNTSDLKKDAYYQMGELIGRQGIEKYYEKYLRGTKGKVYYQKDKFNRIIGDYQDGQNNLEVTQANDIYLTLDIDLQAYGEQLFQNKRGGVVAIEPATGEVLALVTAPSFDPQLLVGRSRSENFRVLRNDTVAKPLFDRGLQAQYAPGSPFKTLNALIALQENTLSPETLFRCDGGHYYAKGAFMECHCSVGTRNNLLSAIYNSCNTYFSYTYRRIIEAYPTPQEGINQWKKHLNSFGLGNYLGYDLPIGQPGYIPDASLYDRVYGERGWKAPTIISNAIGQGEILTTPMQMANFTAAIANRGFYVKPHFMKSISGEPQLSEYEKKWTTVDSIHFETVIEGMHKVVEQGTARVARIKDIEVCGKTGTVENFILLDGQKTQLTDHSMFIAFAPKDNPKIALAVFVENGYWGARWAAPIASLMIEKYLNKTVKRSWLEQRMLNGSLEAEYQKPYSGVPFKINE